MLKYLCRAIVAVILLGVVLYHSAGLMRILERALSAPPYQQAAGIIFSAVIVLLGSIIRNCAAMAVGNDGPPIASIPLGVRLGAGTTSDLERWAEIHKNEGESVEEAVKRLEPLWNQREFGEDISITQRRRHEAAHAVITYALGGTVKSADVHQQGDVGGNVEYFPPIPSSGPAHTMWVRLQITVAGAAQDTIDGILNAGSSKDIAKALCQAVTLTTAAWTPDGYTGPLNPSDLITHAIEVDKQLLEERQDAIAAIEKALTDKDELTGVEVHQILNNLNTPALEPAAEVAG
ncbi:hypothetical protein BKH13_00440 [Actinomyces naeslundii]|uniref:Uncharacterized protein n=1 Tax=Actinomyces naeslundii TaxID=1655 RepID=A0ABX3F5S6_ACTNA|nr:hypothetical protein [Actinomyces naeslundii]OLO86354.1 hypothetical protein BKH13_00440 [Actinomyces naeslundii]